MPKGKLPWRARKVSEADVVIKIGCGCMMRTRDNMIVKCCKYHYPTFIQLTKRIGELEECIEQVKILSGKLNDEILGCPQQGSIMLTEDTCIDIILI